MKSSASSVFVSQLLSNQLWQAISLVAKFILFVGLAPIMQARWSLTGFGVFALSSSTLISATLLDFGFRSSLRRYSDRTHNLEEDPLFHSALLVVLVCGSLVSMFSLLAANFHVFGWAFNVPPEHEMTFAKSIALTCAYSFSSLLLEPIAIRGNVHVLKKANVLGTLIALASVAVVLWRKGTVDAAVSCLYVAYIVGNLAYVRREFLSTLGGFRWARPGWSTVATLFKYGWPFYIVSLCFWSRGHLLTFLSSSVFGIEAASRVYLAIRIGDFIVNLGGVISENAFLGICSAKARDDKARTIEVTNAFLYFFVIASSVAVLVGIEMLFRYFMHQARIPDAITLLLILYGVASVWGRQVVVCAQALDREVEVAWLSLMEMAIILAVALTAAQYIGPSGLLLGPIVATVVRFRSSNLVAYAVERSWAEIWLKPLAISIPSLGAAVVAYIALRFTPLAVALVVGGGALAIFHRNFKNLRRLKFG